MPSNANLAETLLLAKTNMRAYVDLLESIPEGTVDDFDLIANLESAQADLLIVDQTLKEVLEAVL